jgi:hypothetical protein
MEETEMLLGVNHLCLFTAAGLDSVRSFSFTYLYSDAAAVLSSWEEREFTKRKICLFWLERDAERQPSP